MTRIHYSDGLKTDGFHAAIGKVDEIKRKRGNLRFPITSGIRGI
jgi:hypothetical protein